MSVFEAYEAPRSLEEALELLAARTGRVRPVAGGTDVLVRLKRGTLPKNQSILLNVKNIPELKTIEATGSSESGSLRVGAAVTMRALEFDETVREVMPILSEVANKIASAQIRAMATIGGNVVNASPAADMAVALLLVEAEVETARLDGGVQTARVPLESFFTGPGETALDDASLVTGFHIPLIGAGMQFAFEKGGVRPAMECAVVSVGCGVSRDPDGVVGEARVAMGAVAPTPIRAREIESFLTGEKLTDETIAHAAEVGDDAIQPISDVRGSAEYRRELVRALLKTALYRLSEAKGGSA